MTQLDKPRIIGVKNFVLEERQPPSEKEFLFVEAHPPLERKSFFQRVREILGL